MRPGDSVSYRIEHRGQNSVPCARRFSGDGRRGDRGAVDWLIARTGATPEVIGVAIEMTHGPVVEALLERGFCVYGINPKQHEDGKLTSAGLYAEKDGIKPPM